MKTNDLLHVIIKCNTINKHTPAKSYPPALERFMGGVFGVGNVERIREIRIAAPSTPINAGGGVAGLEVEVRCSFIAVVISAVAGGGKRNMSKKQFVFIFVQN
ncbi:hypothetical protein ACP275_04G002000 [Erythranthe tilingii]